MLTTWHSSSGLYIASFKINIQDGMQNSGNSEIFGKKKKKKELLLLEEPEFHHVSLIDLQNRYKGN